MRAFCHFARVRILSAGRVNCANEGLPGWGWQRGRRTENAAAALVFPKRSNEVFGVGTEAGDRLGAARRVPKAAFDFDCSEKRAEQARERSVGDGRRLAAESISETRRLNALGVRLLLAFWTALNATVFLVWRFLL